MNPVTHLLAGWVVADATPFSRRDRNLMMLSGVLPDLDGMGAAVDLGTRLLGREETAYFGLYHHWLLHGLFGSVLIAGVLAAGAKRRAMVFLFAFGVAHLHLLCDLVGSHGPGPDEIWPIDYLAPFSSQWTLAWSGQWELNAWPNIGLTVGLLIYAFYRAATAGRSPVELFGERANASFVGAVRGRLGRDRSATRFDA